jgi:hypothetical protein
VGSKKINVRTFLEDIRQGIPHSELLEKYQLSERQFEAIKGKLLTSGFSNSADLGKAPSKDQDDGKREKRCPMCGKMVSISSTECCYCAAVFSKCSLALDTRSSRMGVTSFQPAKTLSQRPAKQRWKKVAGLATLLLGAILAWTIYPRSMSQEDPSGKDGMQTSQNREQTRRDLSVPELLNSLRDDNSENRTKAVARLKEQDESVIGPLVEALRDDDWRVRWGAAAALGGIWIPSKHELLCNEVAARLADVAEDDPSPKVKQAGLKAIMRLEGRCPVGSFVNPQ